MCHFASQKKSDMAGFGKPKIQHGFYPVWESNLADTLLMFAG